MPMITRRRFGALVGVAAAAAGLPARAETTLERIRRTGKLTVGTEAAFPPFEFVKDGEIVGYGKDILVEVVAKMGVELEQLDLPWQGILPGVLAGKFDFVATTVGINEERAQRYAYTVPIANGQPYFAVRKGDTMKTEEDLRGKVVGTQLASSTEPIARAVDERLRAEGGAGFRELKLYTAFTDCYVALANGEIDAVIQSLPSLASLVSERSDIFDLGGPVETGTNYTYLAWVTRPDDLDLRDFISEVIIEMRDDGRLAALQQKWFGFEMDIPTEGFLPPGAF
ncbi:transporter substrate-binding domain-containing protein [Rubrimonas sp.]|uniref:transporter substrate-binding domain-containing protein n=1 Tax=Rubrimonas sp. TaxID=2036015 RepID=UPI002FDF0480